MRVDNMLSWRRSFLEEREGGAAQRARVLDVAAEGAGIAELLEELADAISASGLGRDRRAEGSGVAAARRGPALR
eukprot:2178910-Pyramimonas_sp.AAC.1